MKIIKIFNKAVGGIVVGLLSVAVSNVNASACRISDFSSVKLSELEEIHRLAFISEMTATEFARYKQANPGDSDYHAVVAQSDSVNMANKMAFQQLEDLGIENFDGYRKIWATDFLDELAAEEFADCVSAREPGLTVLGIPYKDPSKFRITLAHITPVGIEKISTRLVAFHNIKNIKAFEAWLADIGPQDNYTARSFVLERDDPSTRSVVILRAGWESPDFIYIPSYVESRYFSAAQADK